jgi:hypothetical protein
VASSTELRSPPDSRDPEPEAIRLVYQEVCKGHSAISDFRAKLLALLPAASGASVFVLLEKAKESKAPIDPALLTAIGLFGFAVTFGLFMYELRGIQDCNTLRARAAELEENLRILPAESQFRSRPAGKLAGLADELGASWIVYTAVLMAWLYVAGTGLDLGDALGWGGWPWALAALYVVVLELALLPPARFGRRLARDASPPQSPSRPKTSSTRAQTEAGSTAGKR